MASRGVLHIIRNFNDLDKSGVYDMAYTMEDGDIRGGNRIRRFFGDQELTDFLQKHLNRNSNEIQKMMQELHQNGRARIVGISLPDELRDIAA